MNAIYIHIPYCVRKCPYCAFYSIENSHVGDYLKALFREMEVYKDTADDIDSIYIGGGTPSVLSAGQIGEIVTQLDRNFAISPDCEMTIEVNPETISYNYLADLRKIGVNRLSIGVQSLNDKELKILGRIHDSKKAIDAITDSRKAGFENISVDVITAIPNQTIRDLEKTLGEITQLYPEHISSYSLTIEPDTQFEAMIAQNQLATNKSDKELFYFAIDFLEQNGYEHYELLSFSKDTLHRSRHNLKYWDRKQYIGLGASAHSFIGNTRFNNVADIQQYINSPQMPPVENGENLTENEIIEETIMLGLRRIDGFHINSLPTESDYAKKALDNINRLLQEGFLSQKYEKIAINKDYLFISDEIVKQLLP